MALIGQLYSGGRAAERHDLGADATVRGPDRVPIDVLVADLSRTGCLFVSTEPLTVDAVITIGIAGVGLREARIVRNQDVRFGCTFLVPLTQAELTDGLTQSQTVAMVPIDPLAPGEDDALPPTFKLPRLARLLVFAGLGIASWVVVLLALRALA